jgi:lysozyme
MKTSKAGFQLVKESEGLRLRAYPDSVGVCTIGYGHTRGVEPGDICDEDQALAWLLEDIACVETALGNQIFVPLTQGQFDALVDFVFNLGAGALAGSTLRRKLNAGDYAGAAAEFPKWCRAGNQVLPGLATRRARERALFEGVNDGA